MKKTLSHICVLLPLAMVLAACEPETRVVEKPIEVEVTRIVEMPVEVVVTRVVEMPAPTTVTRTVEKPPEEAGTQPAGDGEPTPATTRSPETRSLLLELTSLRLGQPRPR